MHCKPRPSESFSFQTALAFISRAALACGAMLVKLSSPNRALPVVKPVERYSGMQEKAMQNYAL
jgi:hypothetical protein